MDLPPKPLTIDDVRSIGAESDVNELVPYYRNTASRGLGRISPRDLESRVFFVDTADERVEGWYFDPSKPSWNRVASVDRENPPITKWIDDITGEVLFIGDDASRVEDLYLQVEAKANRAHSDPVIAGPDVASPEEMFTEDFLSCDHPDGTQGIKTQSGQKIGVCERCGYPQKTRINGTEIPVSSLFQESVLLKDDSITWVETDAADLALLSDTRYGIGALLADTLATIAKVEVHYATEFDPELYDVAFLIEDGLVKGLVLYNVREDWPVARQAVIHPRHRGEGASVRLKNGWYEAVCDGEKYLAEAPNEAGRQMLASVGHLPVDESRGEKAVLSHSLSPDVVDPGRY
ncbi:hypothetical protein [Halorhabdus tiamatea]|nr:hypothetical protein [Halorhabdus tiamatea]